MLHAILFIGDYRTEIYILHTLKDIALDKRICFLQFTDEFFDLQPLGIALSILIAGRAGIREFACTLNEMKSIRITPRLNIVLTDQISGRISSIPSKLEL